MAATLTSTGVNFSDGTTINGTATNTIGSYSMLGRISGDATMNIGSTLAGSNLRPAGFVLAGLNSWSAGIGFRSVGAAGQGTTMAGTWRCMGYTFSGTSGCDGYGGGTLWVRIS